MRKVVHLNSVRVASGHGNGISAFENLGAYEKLGKGSNHGSIGASLPIINTV